MQYLKALACALALAPATVFSLPPAPVADVNPYLGKAAYANKGYATKLEETITYFKSKRDHLNAAKTKTVQKTPTFAWISASKDVCMLFIFILQCVYGPSSGVQHQRSHWRSSPGPILHSAEAGRPSGCLQLARP